MESSIESFNLKFNTNNVPVISEPELRHVCQISVDGYDELPHAVVLRVILNLSYLVFDNGDMGQLSLETVQKLITRNKDTEDKTVEWLIGELQPSLLCIEHNSRTKRRAGLNPTVGISYKEDEARRDWKKRGGLKSLPLFYVILLHMKHHQVSPNLWWITPGILNLLDDTTDLYGIKLKAVLLLRTFLERSFDDDTRWISFEETGLFKLYEPVLLNMCYYLPPAFSSSDCLKVWKEVFPTLNSLYCVQFKSHEAAYRKYLGKFLSEIILQQVIPRINLTNEVLADFALRTLIKGMKILQTSTLYFLPRIIFTIGESLVRNPFFTAFEMLLNRTIETLGTIVKVCPTERLVAHKYDLLALLLITYEKCKREGKLTDSVQDRLKLIIRSLEAKGCDFTADKSEVLKQKNVHELFS